MSTIGLKELLELGTVPDADLEKKEITWTSKKDGKERTFDIFIVTEVSFATAERIYTEKPQNLDSSRMSRIISERVRLDDGTTSFSPEQAARLEPALGYALVAAVFEYDQANSGDKESDAAKT